MPYRKPDSMFPCEIPRFHGKVECSKELGTVKKRDQVCGCIPSCICCHVNSLNGHKSTTINPEGNRDISIMLKFYAMTEPDEHRSVECHTLPVYDCRCTHRIGNSAWQWHLRLHKEKIQEKRKRHAAKLSTYPTLLDHLEETRAPHCSKT
jgi:hypothetical protein